MRATAFRAMGTDITVILPEQASPRGTQLVRELFATWERHLSRFQPESELSRLNASSGAVVPASALLLKVLEAALAAARATDGLYDPTLERQMIYIGYDRTFDAVPAEVPVAVGSHARSGGWHDIRIDRLRGTVRLPPGVGLDFGGIAKGMAVDAAIATLAELGATQALVNAGGDLAVLGEPPDADAWQIQIDGRVAPHQIALRAGALATSGKAKRHWQQGNRERHHLLDPRTGESAQSGVWSVTAGMPRCQQAEVAAKVAFILGPEDGAAFLEQRNITALMQLEHGGDIRTGAWPVDDTVEAGR